MNTQLSTAAIYIRVSTDDQMELSPDSQLMELRDFASKNGYLISKEYTFIETEGISGRKSKNRPEFQRMIACAKTTPKPFDTILVWKYSRFARNQDESTFYKSMLRKKLGIDVISASEPIIDGMYGRLMEMIIEWQDEFYSYNLSMEVKRSMRAKALKGDYNGAKFPIGYIADENRLPIIDPATAPIVTTIYEMYVSGYDKNYIVRYLNNNGYQTKFGCKFTTEAVEYILGNPFYIGKVRWNMRESSSTSKKNPEDEWIISDAKHEPLISDNLFNCAKERTSQIKLTYAKHQHPISHTKHWLSGLVKCPICGKSLSLKKGYKNGSDGFQCLGYRMGLHNESQYISERKLTTYVLESLRLALVEQEFQFEIVQQSNKEYNTLRIYQDELKRIEVKSDRAKVAYLNEIDTLEEYRQNKELLEGRHKELTALIQNLSTEEPDEAAAKDKMLSNIKNVIEILESDCYYMEKATALRSIIKKIVFFKELQALVFSYYISI
ncbi:MAG: recombinase family protein [Eubacteriales bacterium]